MDLMTIRRMLMTIAGSDDMGGWKKTTITVDQNYTDGGACRAWLLQQIPTASILFAINDIDWEETPTVNNLFGFVAVIDRKDSQNRDVTGFVRWRSNTWAAAVLTNGYDIVINAGDTLTILYLE